jgi:pimeloyl-ACP methyl ester carboxylesterase
MPFEELPISTPEVNFVAFTAGEGPLALLLHGYPDTAHTWRHLIPELSAAGYRVVAPFMRGYAPTSLATPARYQAGVLGADANAIHQALDATGEAVIIGHDWGAFAAYGAANAEPERWSRVVTLAVPPGPAMASAFFDFDQLKRSWYMFFQLNPLSSMVVPMNDFAYMTRIWADWSPGYDATEDLAALRASIGEPANTEAALSYYRDTLIPERADPELATLQAGTLLLPTQPLCYLHGANDGCLGVEIARPTAELLHAPSRYVEVDEAGHFLQLEQPALVNQAILDFLEATR